MSALDRDRIVSKLGQLDAYLAELDDVAPQSFEAYQSTAARRACERLLQLAIETVIDVSALLVSELRLGVPGEEEDLIMKLESADVLTESTAQIVRSMKGFRNILVHRYGSIDDRIVYEKVRTGREDFQRFKKEILEAMGELGAGKGQASPD